MTCIAALKHKDKVYMASECQTTTKGTTFLINSGKVFLKSEMMIGISGHSRFNKILRYNFNIPDHNPSLNDMEYMNSVFVDSLRELCNKIEFSTKKDSKTEMECSALIGYKDNIYKLFPDYNVSTYNCNYMSIGSGFELALGSLHTTDKLELDLTPEERLKLAIESAITHDNGCGGDVVILSL